MHRSCDTGELILSKIKEKLAVALSLNPVQVTAHSGLKAFVDIMVAKGVKLHLEPDSGNQCKNKTRPEDMMRDVWITLDLSVQ